MLIVYFRSRHTGRKPDISYPASVIHGNAVQSSFNSHSRRQVSESDESETDASEYDSEDEIERIKNKYKHDQLQQAVNQAEQPVYPEETAVFVPKINRADLMSQDTGNDVDLLKRFDAVFRRVRTSVPKLFFQTMSCISF